MLFSAQDGLWCQRHITLLALPRYTGWGHITLSMSGFPSFKVGIITHVPSCQGVSGLTDAKFKTAVWSKSGTHTKLLSPSVSTSLLPALEEHPMTSISAFYRKGEENGIFFLELNTQEVSGTSVEAAGLAVRSKVKVLTGRGLWFRWPRLSVFLQQPKI